MHKRRLLVVLVIAGAVLIGAFLNLLLHSSNDATAPQLHGARLTLVPAARRRPLPDLREIAGAVLIGAFLNLLLHSSNDATAPQLHGARLTLVPAARRRPLPDLR